jgi:hypothetical protein
VFYRHGWWCQDSMRLLAAKSKPTTPLKGPAGTDPSPDHFVRALKKILRRSIRLKIPQSVLFS